MKTFAILLSFLCLYLSSQAQIDRFQLPGYEGLPINGGGAWAVVPLDIEADGDIDFIVLRAHEYDELYLNDGQGHFSKADNIDRWQIPGGSFSFAKANMNADGIADFIIGRGPASGSSRMSSGRDMILIHDPLNARLLDASLNLPADDVASCLGVNFRTDTSNYSMGVATGDFNKDGIPDIVMANGGIIYQIRIEPLKPFSVNGGGIWYTPLFCSNFRDKLLENNLYMGQADGSVPGMPIDGVYDFINVSDSSGIGQYIDVSTGVVVGDFNGDEYEDFFISNFHDEGLRDLLIGTDLPFSSGYSKLFLNDPNNPGHFSWAETKFPAITLPATSVATADFDQDGDLDLFLTMEPRARYTAFSTYETAFNLQPKLFLNDGQGNFSEDTDGKIPLLEGCQQSLYDAHFADVNADGWLDIFCVGVQNVLFIQNPDDHSFINMSHQLPTQASSGNPYSFHAYGSAVLDVNGDDRPDLLMVDTYEQNRLHIQGDDLNFSDMTTINLPADGENNTDVAIADLDLDGDLDIVAAIYEDCAHLQSVHIQSAQSNGYALFEDRSDIFPANRSKSSDRGVEIFDLDEDGLPEVLFTGYNSSSRLYKNTGQLNFIESTASLFPDLAQFNAVNRARLTKLRAGGEWVAYLPTGVVDAVASGGIPMTDALYRWNGAQFAQTDWIPTDARVTTTVDFVDLNGDGWKDMLLVHEDSKMELLISQNPSPAQPNYRSHTPPAFVSNYSIDALFVDIEGDGDWDIIENTSCCAGRPNDSSYFSLYLNQGTFTGTTPDFIRKTFGSPPFQAAALETSDLDADGDMDVILADRDSIYFFLWDDDQQEMRDFTSQYTHLNSVSGLALSTYAISKADFNQDGLSDLYLARDNQDLLLYGVGNPTNISQPKHIESTLLLKAFPNPTTDRVFLSFSLPQAGVLRLELMDHIGRGIMSYQLEGFSGENMFELDLGEQTSGLYVLCLSGLKVQACVKVIKR